MTQEEIVSKLTQELGETPLSQRSISEYVGVNMPKEDEEFDYAHHITILNSFAGNYRADIKKEIEEFKKNYKPTIDLPKPKEEKKEEPFNPNSELESLKKEFSELKQLLKDKESKEEQKSLKSKVIEAMKRQKATDEYVLKATFKGITLDTEKSVDELTKEMLKSYDEEFAACRGKGAAPRNGENGGGNKGKTAADAFFANKRKLEGKR